MRSSRLLAVKTPEDSDFTFQPSLSGEQIDSLHELDFIRRKGKCGVPGSAGDREDPPGDQPGDPGRGARPAGVLRVPEGSGRVPPGGGTKGQLQRRRRVLTHPALLVADEIGYLPMTRNGATLFFQLINQR